MGIRGWCPAVRLADGTAAAWLRRAQELDEDIQQQLQDGECADPEYWEAVRRRLQVYLAKARLRDIHYGLQQAHRAALEGNIPAAMGWDLKAGGEEGDAKAEGAPREEGPPREEERPSIADIAAMAEERLAAQRLQYDPATMSPKRVSTENLGKIEIVDEEDDLQLLHQLRAQARSPPPPPCPPHRPPRLICTPVLYGALPKAS